MFFLYILKSTQYHRNYTGVTNSVEKRLMVHNSGGSKSTKPWRPWIVVYTEQFSTLSEAKKREWFLKCTPQGGKEKRKILEKAGIPAPH
jgi:putative endonuclease